MSKERSAFLFLESFYEAAAWLDDADKLELYDAIIRYGLYGEEPELSGALRAVFSMCMANIDQNTAKRDRSKAYGAMGGRPKKETENLKDENKNLKVSDKKPKEPKVLDQKPTELNLTELNLTEHNNIKSAKAATRPSYEQEIGEVISYLNEKTGKQFRVTNEASAKLIRGRLAEGYKVEDFKTVIDKKVRTWKDKSDMAQYLRPDTLFSKSHFDSYLNEVEAAPSSSGKGYKDNKYIPSNNYDYDAILEEHRARLYNSAGR